MRYIGGKSKIAKELVKQIRSRTEAAFDSDAFWGWVRCASRAGADVFVSGYSAPKDFTKVWERSKIKTLATAAQGRDVATEGLWVYVG